MLSIGSAQNRRVGILLYVLAVAVIAVPVFDWFAAVLPLHPSAATWRFGAAGLIGQGLINGTIGVVLLYVAAVLLEHRSVRRLIGSLAGLASLALLAMLVVFALDALELRRGVRPEMKRGFDFNVVRTTAMLTWFALLYGLLTWFTLRSWREGRRSASTPELIGSRER